MKKFSFLHCKEGIPVCKRFNYTSLS
uniref:Uncharacterized protein n=1 Tax=Anguilla anguilla TaxID=7936 RepID=A0A0E9TSM8_ANGAN